MAVTPHTVSQIRQRATLEMKRYFVLFIYLSLLLGSFGIYRRLILWQYDIDFFRYGYAIIEAAVLAKVIMIGEMLHLGERFRNRPLIVPTLYKTVLFSLFVLAFKVVEEVISRLIHDESPAGLIRKALSDDLEAVLAQALVIFVALIPLFAYRELARVIGERRLFELFYKPQAGTTAGGEDI